MIYRCIKDLADKDNKLDKGFGVGLIGSEEYWRRRGLEWITNESDRYEHDKEGNNETI